jgi:hypothetical protein
VPWDPPKDPPAEEPPPLDIAVLFGEAVTGEKRAQSSDMRYGFVEEQCRLIREAAKTREYDLTKIATKLEMMSTAQRVGTFHMILALDQPALPLGKK